MIQSPVVDLLAVVDSLDVEAVAALCTEDCCFTTADGRRAEGRDGLRRVLGSFFSDLRSTQHRIAEQWHQQDVWIAEVLATYELQDWLRIEDLPRAFFVRTVGSSISDVRVYGANERPLADHHASTEPLRFGGRVVLPL